jgi:hypothetical protein
VKPSETSRRETVLQWRCSHFPARSLVSRRPCPHRQCRPPNRRPPLRLRPSSVERDSANRCHSRPRTRPPPLSYAASTALPRPPCCVCLHRNSPTDKFACPAEQEFFRIMQRAHLYCPLVQTPPLLPAPPIAVCADQRLRLQVHCTPTPVIWNVPPRPRSTDVLRLALPPAPVPKPAPPVALQKREAGCDRSVLPSFAKIVAFPAWHCRRFGRTGAVRRRAAGAIGPRPRCSDRCRSCRRSYRGRPCRRAHRRRATPLDVRSARSPAPLPRYEPMLVLFASERAVPDRAAAAAKTLIEPAAASPGHAIAANLCLFATHGSSSRSDRHSIAMRCCNGGCCLSPASARGVREKTRSALGVVECGVAIAGAVSP